MFRSLPQGIKISISRSIKTAFEQYMAEIGWDERKYKFEDFMKYWRDYSEKNASWFNKLDPETKQNQEFQHDLTNKINETIEKVITEIPTQEQMDQIEELIKALGIPDVDYCCKTEAKYHIETLEENLKKKKNANNPATEKELKMASIVYYQAYEKDLPEKNYTSEGIQQVIEEAKATLNGDMKYEQESEFPVH